MEIVGETLIIPAQPPQPPDPCNLHTEAFSLGDSAHPPSPNLPMELPGAPLSKHPQSESRMCHICKSEFSSNNHVYELSNCKHGFCKPCLASIAAERLLPQLQVGDSPLDFDAIAVSCPLEDCACFLSRQDLRFAVGPGILHMLDQKVASMVTHNVIFPLLRLCRSCKSDSPQRLLLPQTHLSSLPFDALQTALQWNGPAQITQDDLVLLLQQAAPASFICPHCFLFACQDCGANLGPFNGTKPQMHECDVAPARCVSFARSMLRLCSAYAQSTIYTPKNRTSAKSRAQSFSWLISLFICKPKDQPKDQGTQSATPAKSSTDLIYEGCLAKRFEAAMDPAEQKISGADVKAHSSKKKREGSLGSKVKGHGRTAMLAEMGQDKQAQIALRELENYLTFMLNAHQWVLPPMVVALLCSHDLLYTLLKWLVRSDSPMNIIARKALYRHLLSFLKMLSSSWDLLPLLCRSDAEHHDCWGAAAPRWKTPGSIISGLGAIANQAQSMLHWVEPELMSQDDINLVQDIESTYEQICRRIEGWEAAISQYHWSDDGRSMADTLEPQQEQQLLISQLKSLIPHVNTFLPESSSEVSQASIDAYKAALQPLQFDEGNLLSSHYFRNLVKESSQDTTLNKKRVLAINKEIIALSTALPLEWSSSIFVRMDKQHSDVLRALVIGPKGTPYENGVFLFDLWLGAGYPDEPPKVHFLTTGGGKARFNPNLYKNGRVCLSILGTWSGPGWKPGQSSILQVLVSLQALVLVENPFFNEPGMSTVGSVLFNMERDAKLYIKGQRCNTLLYSMLPALRFPDPLFLPIIQNHFRLKAPDILHQCSVWIEEESRPERKKTLLSSFKQIQLELEKVASTA